MYPTFRFPVLSRGRQRGARARFGSLLLVLQRSPLVNLLPEARIISTSGFSRAVQWVVTAVTGLGAVDAVSGASNIVQVVPTANSSTVSGTGGVALSFVFTFGGSDTPDHFQVTGTLPPGLTQTKTLNSKTDSITGVPLAAGSFPITVRAWRDAAQAQESVAANFTIVLAAPPAPAISAQPVASNPTAPGGFVQLAITQTSGFTFTWKKDGTALPAGETVVVSRTSPRKYTFPAADPGTAWRSGAAFNDAAWLSVSGGIGYDTDTAGVNYVPLIAAGGNVQTQMSGSGKPTSVPIRIPFTLSSHAALSYMKIRVQCDDGFVAWLNGTEIASRNKPATLAWNSAASASTDDASAILWKEIDIPQRLALLRTGENLLAVQAMNQTATSSDLLFNCEIVSGINAVNSPRLALTGIQNGDAGNYTVTVTNSTSAVTSDPGTVILPPSILTHPAGVTINSGATANLTVGASISPPFTYQWYRGNSGDTANAVSGATAAAFTTPALTQTTPYWVRVTNAAGSVDSNTAVVTVTVSDPYTVWTASAFNPADAGNPAVSGPAADPDHDGQTNQSEYLFGTTPTAAGAPLVPVLTTAADQRTLSFTAKLASGPGYAGRTRLYTIESATDSISGPWTPVAGFTNIAGNDQVVSYPVPAVNDRTFLRVTVQLSP